MIEKLLLEDTEIPDDWKRMDVPEHADVYKAWINEETGYKVVIQESRVITGNILVGYNVAVAKEGEEEVTTLNESFNENDYNNPLETAVSYAKKQMMVHRSLIGTGATDIDITTCRECGNRIYGEPDIAVCKKCRVEEY